MVGKKMSHVHIVFQSSSVILDVCYGTKVTSTKWKSHPEAYETILFI